MLAAVLIRVAVNPWLGSTVPYLQFFPAILIAAWYGGFGPGVLATCLATAAALIWFLPATRYLMPTTPAGQLALFFFFGIGTAVSYICGSLKRAEAIQRRAAEQSRDAERALRQSQGLLQAISDNSSAVIYAKDLRGRYLLVNRRFCEIFHVSNEGMLGKTDHDLFSVDDAERFREMDRRVAAAGFALTEEERVPLDDGVHTFLSVKSPLRDEKGSVYAVFGISTDITERRRADEAVRANEERTRQIVENALDAVITIDAAGTIVDWSPQAERTFGWRPRDALERPLADLVIPERYREAHRRGLLRFLSTGEGPILDKRLELSALHRDGHEFPVELSITPVKVGGTVSFSAFLRDITERKAMEQAFVESRQHYQTLTESLPHLVWTCRADGYCDFLSRQWVDYTGLPAEEQLGSGWVNQLHPDDRERVQAEWTKATVSGDQYDIEFRIRRADGVYRWFKTRAVPLHDAAGRIVKWFGSNTDFDDYKRSEQLLHEQLERLNLLDALTRAISERHDLQSILQVVVRSLEEHLPLDFCCICLHDQTSDSLVVSRVGARSQELALELALTEKARVDVDQNGLSRCMRGQLVHEPDLTAATAPFSQRLARAGLLSLIAAPLVVESRIFGLLIVARRGASGPASPESGTGGGGFGGADCEFLRQLSEHVALAAHQAHLYSALQNAYDDLRQTQQAVMQQERLKALGQMASGIAHDISNAISPVAVYTESLLDSEPNLSPHAVDALKTIQRAIDDVSQTVARMREFYREREPQLVLAPVNVNRLVQEVFDLTRARWSDMPQQRGVVIDTSTELAPALPSIMGSESEIREALINLIFNAVDAMPGGGRLTLRTRTIADASNPSSADAAPGVQIEVIDTGVGMDADTRRRCLEPFFTTKGERGTGLGLAMVYGMVQRHSAAIEVDSTPGQGTMVRLMFRAKPVSIALVDTSGASGAPRPLARPPKLRVLVVDDDPLLLRSLHEALESDGHAVTAVGGGRAGVDMFRDAHAKAHAFDVVITDLGMPFVDGRQVARAVKQTSPSTPVILLTGWGRRLVEEGEVPSHVDRVLNKPPKLSELRRAFAELTANRT